MKRLHCFACVAKCPPGADGYAGGPERWLAWHIRTRHPKAGEGLRALWRDIKREPAE